MNELFMVNEAKIIYDAKLKFNSTVVGVDKRFIWLPIRI